MASERDNSVRPSIWALVVLFAVGVGFAAYQVSDLSPLHGFQSADDSADGAADGRWRRAGQGHANGDRASRSHRTQRASSGGGGGSYTHHDWSSETAFARGAALGLPGTNFWQDGPSRTAPDPQLIAMWRSFHNRRNDLSVAPALPFEPIAHRLRLTEAEGSVSGNPSSCEIRLLPVESGPFNCIVRVLCDDEVLYPNESQSAGYMTCELGEDGRIVRALDNGHTAGDGDPAIDLNLDDGTIRVWDLDPEGQPRYQASLRIQS